MGYGEQGKAGAAGASALQAVGLCVDLSTAACARLAATAHVETVPPDKVLWHDDAPSPLVGVLVSGYLRFQRYSRDGRRQILNLTVPGDLFGHEDDRRAGYTLESATEAVLCRFDRRTFDRLLTEDGTLRRALYRYNEGNLDRLRWLTWTIGALRPEERIAAFLLKARAFLPYRDLPDGTGLLSLAIGRRDMADLLSTSVETICRVFKGMERAGVIRLLDPAQILVLDPAALAARAAQPVSDLSPRPQDDTRRTAMTLVNDPEDSARIPWASPAWRARRPD